MKTFLILLLVFSCTPNPLRDFTQNEKSLYEQSDLKTLFAFLEKLWFKGFEFCVGVKMSNNDESVYLTEKDWHKEALRKKNKKEYIEKSLSQMERARSKSYVMVKINGVTYENKVLASRKLRIDKSTINSWYRKFKKSKQDSFVVKSKNGEIYLFEVIK